MRPSVKSSHPVLTALSLFLAFVRSIETLYSFVLLLLLLLSPSRQARANNKRATKPETAAAAAASTTTGSKGVSGTSALGSGSGPALRERRNRPATRRSGGSNAQQRPPPQFVATAAAAGSAASFPPQARSSSMGAPGADNNVDSKAGVVLLHTVPAAVRTAAGAPLLSSAPAGSDTIAAMGASSLSLSDQPRGSGFGATGSGASSVVGEDPAVPVAVVCGAPVSSGVGVSGGGGNRKKASRKVPVAAPAKGEGEDAAIRAWDGGLVRGVVSHVSALITCASRQQEEQQRLQHQCRPGPNTEAVVAAAAAASAGAVGGM